MQTKNNSEHSSVNRDLKCRNFAVFFPMKTCTLSAYKSKLLKYTQLLTFQSVSTTNLWYVLSDFRAIPVKRTNFFQLISEKNLNSR